MIQEYIVEDWNSYISTITDIVERQHYRMWYRGQAEYSWGLIPSVQRRKSIGCQEERYVNTNFMIETMRLRQDTPSGCDHAGWLALMQHYGLPTRLLDWSESPLIAFYFALDQYDGRICESDAAVWVLNPMRLNEKMEYGPYVPPISYDGNEDYLSSAFKDNIELTNKIVAAHGIGNDLRMYVQQSNFTIHDSNECLDEILQNDVNCDYLYKIRIPNQMKTKFRMELDILGFHSSTVYPDMEHIALEQARLLR